MNLSILGNARTRNRRNNTGGGRCARDGLGLAGDLRHLRSDGLGRNTGGHHGSRGRHDLLRHGHGRRNCRGGGRIETHHTDLRALTKRGGRFDVYLLHVDLHEGTVRDDAGFAATFTVDPFRRQCLLGGLDDIALSLRHTDAISAWEAAHGLPAAGG